LEAGLSDTKKNVAWRHRRNTGAACAGEAGASALDHAEHDGADEGHGEVRGDNAQSPGERHDVAPGMLPLIVRCAPDPSWLTESLFPKKSALLSLVPGSRARRRGPVWLKNTEINMLKSL
jgi:hypothetical protein